MDKKQNKKKQNVDFKDLWMTSLWAYFDDSIL